MTNINVLTRKSSHTLPIHNQTFHSRALADIISGLKNWPLWLFLGWHDIKLNYRRSTLGPLWITLSMAITISSMGLLYGKLFKMDLNVYYPFLATGMLSWGLISSLILEGMNIFVDAESFIKQMKQPYSMFVFRTISKIFIIFLHNVVILIPMALFFNLNVTLATLFLPIALLLLWLNAVSYCTILSMVSARFRDLKPIITSLMQVIFFLTPVMWTPALIPPQYKFIIDLNPFAQFLQLLRAPLLGTMPNLYTLSVVLTITVVGLFSAFFIFSAYRSRISYWL